jgi:AraC family transcriptional regulator of adaptative response/methylated-DNA-[protein]-cysteine methyltransferase
LAIRYGRVETPFGRAWMATTSRGICCLLFLKERKEVVVELECRYPGARVIPSDRTWQGSGTLHIRGTDFQVAVWQALLEIPPGEMRTYSEIAVRVGHPTSYRAVGAAAKANPVSLFIPCHRVGHTTGSLGQYRWGPELKRAILAREGCYPK